jgi:hypothetical protein
MKVYETTLAIVPIGESLRAEMTLARIDALSAEHASETILPPSSLHPDLLGRGLEIERRVPFLVSIYITLWSMAFVAAQFGFVPHGPGSLLLKLIGIVVLLAILFFGGVLPRSIRERLPRKAARKR